jgi:hypothetical protein
MKKSMLYKAILAAVLATSSSAALAVEESEFNSPIQTANRVVIGSDGTVVINATLSGIGDVDYFSFEGKEGDAVQIDIDGGMTSATSGVDTMIALFGPGPACPDPRFDSAFNVWAFNNVARNPNLDDGSVSDRDARINEFRLNSTGVWTVGVSHSGKQFECGGGLKTNSETSFNTGTYTLTISGVTPSMQLVNIDVRPGQPDPANVNPKAKGVIPVAILGQAGFDVKDVNVASLTFGHTGDEKTLRHCQKNYQDFNKDGFVDLLCHFENGDAGFGDEDVMGTVKGKKVGGKDFRGHGKLKARPVVKE